MKAVYPVILSGGSGDRLWPLSRKSFPKQFLKLCSENTLLQETIKRAQLISSNSPLIIGNEEHHFLISAQLQEFGLKAYDLILEPFGRNTAPAITIAALTLLEKDSEAYILVLPADHIIKDEKNFIACIQASFEFAQNGQIVIFGIKPSSPNTNYGYIKVGKRLPKTKVFQVAEFIEKPKFEKAQEYLNSNNYFWNAGIFLVKASLLITEIEKYNSRILSHCQSALKEADRDLNFVKLNKEHFQKCQSVSIDYALIEKTTKTICCILEADWSDIGSWSSLWEISDKDQAGNVLKGDTYTVSCKSNFIQSTSRLVAAVGIEDLIIVETDNAILITKKGHEAEIKRIVQELKNQKNENISSAFEG